MRLNIISRIASDKDFFSSYLNTIFLLKRNHDILIKLYFIGPIESNQVYENIVKEAEKLNVIDLISFSKQSMPYNELPNSYEDFYLNVCIGDFIGYSSIECIENEFKTIFLNMDIEAKINNNFRCFCENELQFYNLLMNLNINNSIAQLIENENRELKESFFLNANEKVTLKNILNGI